MNINNLSPEKPKRLLLRHNMTHAETILWSYLRAKKLKGYKFYRQYGIGKFVVDFYCYSRRLVIELDGEIHKEHVKYDNERTLYLDNNGIRVIRFWNYEVIKHPDDVCRRIVKYLQ